MVDPLIALDEEMDRLRRGNIMARQRMIVLYDRSSRERGLVVGTGNKTETLLGYSTLFGDSACAINPLGDLYKTQVWQLFRMARNSGCDYPKSTKRRSVGGADR
jgi:NAD+ synthase